MNEIITKLNEIEVKAGNIISDALEQKEQMAVRLEAEKKEIDEKYNRMEQEAVEDFLKQCRASSEKQLQEMREKNTEALEKLEKIYAEQKERMAEEIFERIVQ